MTRHNVRFVLSFIAAASCLLVPSPAAGQDDARALSGIWRGSYVCDAGTFGLELDLRGNAHGVVHGVFRYLNAPPDLPSGYPLLGRLSGTALVLRPIDTDEIPPGYTPAGLLATVGADERQIAGTMDSAACRGVELRKGSDAAPGDSLADQFGSRRRWVAAGRMPGRTFYLDGSPRPAVAGASTARLWIRLLYLADDPEMGAVSGQMAEFEVEYDCPARLSRMLNVVDRASDGTITDFENTLSFHWQPIKPQTTDDMGYQRACGAR